MDFAPPFERRAAATEMMLQLRRAGAFRPGTDVKTLFGRGEVSKSIHDLETKLRKRNREELRGLVTAGDEARFRNRLAQLRATDPDILRHDETGGSAKKDTVLSTIVSAGRYGCGAV